MTRSQSQLSRSQSMQRTYICADIQKLEAHLSLTKDRKLRKKVRGAIQLKREQLERIKQ